MWVDSPHFKDGRFFFPGDRGVRGLGEVLRWKMTSKPAAWPVIPAPAPQPPPAAPTSGILVTFIGHASFLVQTPTTNFLIDPVFSERASPFTRIGPKRAVPPGISYRSLPRIDVVLVSHDHYDHCDRHSLKALARDHEPILVTPLGFGPLLGRLGYSEHLQLDWWQEHRKADWDLTLVPSRHWSRRKPWDTNTRLWGGFHLRAAGQTLYFVGDSGYHADLFIEIGRRLAKPDLALIPIGAYEPRWFMAEAHMNPAEAVQVHLDVGAKRSVGMHWGTFQLTDEGRDQPVIDLRAAVAERSLTAAHFTVLDPGQSQNA